jgi:hypothetical protein
MGETTGADIALVEKPEGRRPLGKRKRRWEEITTGLKWTLNDEDATGHTGECRVTGFCRHGNELLGSIKSIEFID